MPIDYTLYQKTREKCIKNHRKDKRLFLFDFRVNAKRYRHIYRLQELLKKPKDNLAKARVALEELKMKLKDEKQIDKITLNQLFYNYMINKPKTDWNQKKRDNFDLYIGESKLEHIKRVSTRNHEKVRKLYLRTKIGHKDIQDIKPMDIERIISIMIKNKLSARTQKVIVEILNPLFNYAVQNRYLNENPSQYITIKIPSQKRVVTDASTLFKKVHRGIEEYYKDNPFYRTFFLFGFTGRRKSEILNLKWKNIDIRGDYYWIENTKNGETQRYPLPAMVKLSLMQIKMDRQGYVFKNHLTKERLKNPDRQMKNLKEFIGVENLTMHYMRNILVSALAENSVEAITLSGVLGHKQVGTINKYLSQNTMNSGLRADVPTLIQTGDVKDSQLK